MMKQKAEIVLYVDIVVSFVVYVVLVLRDLFRIMAEIEDATTIIIKCTIIYYEKGRSGENYREKENVRVQVPKNLKSLKRLEEIAR